ncbi:zinc finger protein 770-like [Megalops cyprinoides]|uniref:zinc finger protein 770-like n=1 Tax=Megalops cyprinoides TaxID=118141 RepID=UPI001863B459|nr:zinc finger protein 770-like [Megalops cyprinoides]
MSEASLSGSSKVIRRNYQCPECPKSFSAPSKLRRHCLGHTGQRPFLCGECGRGFRQRAHLNTHRQTHRRVQRVQGSLCGPRAGYLSQAETQNSCHSDPGPSDNNPTAAASAWPPRPRDSDWLPSVDSSVNVLLSEWQSRDDASIHQSVNECRTEQGQPPKVTILQNNTRGYQCSVCFKLFPFASKLWRHSLTHAEPRPIQCHSGGLVFRQVAQLKRHPCWNQSRKLDGYRCTKGAGDAQNQTVELAEFGQEISCNQNPGQRGSSSQLGKRNTLDVLLNVSVKPEHCGDPRAVEKKSTQQRKPYQCGICSKHFSAPSKLQRHILIHTGQRPFECHVCGKRLRQLAHMKPHLRTHFSPRHVPCRKTRVDSDSLSSGQVKCDGVNSVTELRLDAPLLRDTPEKLHPKGSAESKPSI